MASPSFDPTDNDRISPDLLRLLGRAVQLTRASDETEDVQINFTTLLIAFLVSDDVLSLWFQDYVRAAGINPERIYDAKSIQPDELDRIREDEAPEKYLTQIKEVSYSTTRILDQAAELAERLASWAESPTQQPVQHEGGSLLDTRHVMGAYIYTPSGHEEQLAGWGFDRVDWSNAFLEAIVRLYGYGQAQIPVWREIHAEVFGSPPRMEAKGVPGERPPEDSMEAPTSEPEAMDYSAGPSPIEDASASPIEDDSRSVLTERLPRYNADRARPDRDDDLLEITPDVNALAALIAAKNTVPSLAIGIFGDWGSGKTFFMRSLMRRIDELTAAARSPTVDDLGLPVPEQPQSQIAFYKRIVQIEFNAWHYVEGNLWASLVEHIFSNLRVAQDPKWAEGIASPEEIQAHLLGRLEIAQRAAAVASDQAQAAQDRLTEAQDELDKVVQERERRQSELADLSTAKILAAADWSPIRHALDPALEALGIPKVANQVDAVVNAIADARLLIRKSGPVLAPLQKAKDRKRRLRLLAAALLAGPLIGGLAWLIGGLVGRLGQQPDLGALVARIAGLASGAATGLGAIATWLRSQTKWTGEQLARIEQANQQLDALQAETQTEFDNQIAQLQIQTTALNAEYTVAAQKAETAQQRVQEIKAQLQQAAPARLLARFIEDRTESDDYRKHLGVLALVRRDFEALSDHIEQQNNQLDGWESLEQELKDAALRINRIVLYIDDLDRCPPDKVVQVLQAVHLLLAFPLFVVVVGVDARWVSHALEEHYPHLKREQEGNGAACLDDDSFGFGRDATPHDYLEKIFQIPIWLHPIGEPGSCRMLDGLLEDEVVPDAPARRPAGRDGQPSAKQPLPGQPLTPVVPVNAGSTVGESVPLPGNDPRPVPSTLTVEEVEEEEAEVEESEAVKSPIDLTPESLNIYKSELAFMRELAGIVGRSPRAIKRFVNLYRLLKATLEQTDAPLETGASLPIGELLARDGHNAPAVQMWPSDQEVVLLLLAVVTGLPDISRRFFDLIPEWEEQEVEPEPVDLERNLSWALDQLHEAAPGIRGAETDLERLETWLNGPRDNNWLLTPLDHFARRAGQVARYSFRVEQR